MTATAPPPLPVVPSAPITASTEIPVRLVEASKWYGDVIGVNQLTLDFRPGITGLLGPNGAGKSTLLKLVTGQLRPSRGRVELFGQSPWQNPAVFAKAGFCPDSESLYDDMTAFQFVQLMGRLSGLGSAESAKRARTCLERTTLTDAMNRRMRGYSKGMRQRTKLAAAMIHEPSLIVLDEPLNGLDPVGRIQMLELFRCLAAEGRTIIVSSHILHEIENLTSTVVLIHQGRMLAEGRISEVRALMENQPLTLRVQCTNPRVLGSTLAVCSSVSSLTFESNGISEGIVVRTNQPEEVYSAIQVGVLENRFSVTQLSALDDNLEAVFQYLVKE